MDVSSGEIDDIQRVLETIAYLSEGSFQISEAYRSQVIFLGCTISPDVDDAL